MKISPEIKEKIVVLIYVLVFALGVFTMAASYELMKLVAGSAWTLAMFKIYYNYHP
tara:strand:- start:232 stop:399 length:168 start_codon:yes stop_codon:yes gene_type:complete